MTACPHRFRILLFVLFRTFAAPIVLETSCLEAIASPEQSSISGIHRNFTLSRIEFAQRMSQINVGTPKAEIVALLGRPDDVYTERDPDGLVATDSRETWCYGSNGHLTFPTLGQIYIDLKGTAKEIYGGKGIAPPVELFDEDQLRHLLRLIDSTPPIRESKFDPLKLIRIVNELRTLGNDKALGAISEYLRVAPMDPGNARGGLFLVLRVLFDVPKDPGYMPRMLVGMPSPAEPEDPRLIPRWPIAIVNDVPLLLVEGYMLAGMAEPVERHVAYFRQHGTLRSKPLVPADHPLRSLADLERSDGWLWGKEYFSRGHRKVTPNPHFKKIPRVLIMNQLLRLVDSVYRLNSDDFVTDEHVFPYVYATGKESKWPSIVTHLDKLAICWKPVKQQYTFANGRTLPVERRIVHYRSVWRPPMIALEPEVIIQRRSENYVAASLNWSYPERGKAEPVRIRVVRSRLKGTPLVQFTIPGSETAPNSGHMESTEFQLRSGESVCVEVHCQRKLITSPDYVP